MPRFLILRFSSIGDIVLTSPVVRMLKTQVKDAEVHYATKAKFGPLLSSNPYIDKVFLLNDKHGDLIKKLKRENYDYIIDLHHNLRTFIIKKALGKKSFSFNKLNFQKWLLVNFKINKLPQAHIVDRYLETLKTFHVKNDGEGLDFFIPGQDKISIQSLPQPHHEGYVSIAIGAQHGTKKLPPEKIIEMIRTIKKPVVLLGDDKDKPAAEKILSELNDKSVYNACGKFSLNQSASIIQNSLFVISHDTGLMHIASALKKKVVSVWGNTVPEFGMYPYGTEYLILENKNLNCRPCSKIGFEKCPKGHFKCMKEISFEKLKGT
jgi:heptosyltransferase-2